MTNALAQEPGEEALAVVSVQPIGFVVLTQTCDIVRPWLQRPYVEIGPIVTIPDDQILLVQGGYVPRFAALPALAKKNAVADLDRVMTVEKGLLAALTEQRQRGVETEQQMRFFAEMLGRKRIRPALPDLFTTAIGKLHGRIKDKHDKNTPEGKFLAAIKEIRVRGIPDWSSDEIEVEFIFIFDMGANIPLDADDLIAALLNRVECNTLVIGTSGRAVGLDQLSAATYLESDRLDLDRLSRST